MTIFKYYILVALALSHVSYGATNESLISGSISGKITTIDSKPAEDVSIYLKSAGGIKTSITNENGYFEFTGLRKGKYSIEIGLVGYETIRKEVEVELDSKLHFNFQLKLKNQQLKEVLVAAKLKKLNIGKMNIASHDMPLSASIISNKIIEDQQVTRLGDLVKNVPGVSLVQTRFGVNETYGARGYSIGVTGGAGGGSIFKNGLPYNIAGMPEAATLESVEIIKGSSAFLYGSSSGGIIINMNNKKPKFENGGNMSLQIGSYQMYKPVIDIYGPLTKKLAYRIVGTYENANSFRDQVKTIRKYINPSLLYKISDKTNLLIQQEFLNASLKPDFGIGILDSGRVLNTSIPRSRYQNVSWAYNNVIQLSSSVNLKHSFNERFSLNASASIQNSDIDSYGTGNLNTANKIGDVVRTLSKAHSLELTKAAQINLEGKFNIKTIENHFLFGADYTHIITNSDAFNILKNNGSVLKVYDTINFLNPTRFVQNTYVPNSFKTNTTIAPSTRAGVYLQNLVTINQYFKLFMGLRYSYQATIQTSIDSTSTSLRPALTIKGSSPTVEYKVLNPKAGLVYQPNKEASYYFSFANNFTTNTGTDVYGNVLPASVMDQFELGAKHYFLKGKLSSNIAIYKIVNSSFAQQAAYKSDGITPNTDATVKSLSGETTSEGIEIGLNGNINRDFYFITGYGFNNIRFTNTSGKKGGNIEGEQLVNAPNHTANLSIFYTINQNVLKGLKMGITGFYTGKRYGGYQNTIGQSILGSRLIPLSDFTTIDISLGYTINNASIQCKLSNIFNTLNYLIHDNYSINPIAPRQIQIGIQYKLN
jgi:iron complex outermembrane receptor protein